MAEIHTFEVGYCTHPACMALQGEGLASRRFPARAYLIVARAGLYLWDTGYAARFAETARGIYAPYRWLTPVHYRHEQDHLRSQLTAHGVAPGDLRAILLSHFHADHYAGLDDFPQLPLYASTAALAGIRGLSGVRALVRAFIPELLPRDFAARVHPLDALPPRPLPAALAPFTAGWPVDENGEIWIIALPGHALGHVGACVQTAQGWQLLASDAAWAHEGYRELRGPSEFSFLIQHDRAAYYRTLHALHTLHQRGTVAIHLSHEPSRRTDNAGQDAPPLDARHNSEAGTTSGEAGTAPCSFLRKARTVPTVAPTDGTRSAPAATHAADEQP
jgi:glyoxylase-like metal-dependent hydrolase (beta-lactamase superfamily II)